MTSNIGSDLLLKELETKKEMQLDQILAILQPVLNAQFRPEFLNRIDEILPFHPLQPKDMINIVDLQITTLQKRLLEQNIILLIDKSATEYLATKGYDQKFGARPLRRLIQKEISNPIADLLIQGKISQNSKLKVYFDKVLQFDYEKAKKAKSA